jgi:hypothetical protein
MPRKRKQTEPPPWDFELNFTDPTMVETEGKFSAVKELIEGEFPFPKEWNIKSRLTILSPFGVGEFVLNFRQDKSVYIIQFASSSRDMQTSPEIGVLTRWCSLAGWKIPEPSTSLIQENLYFWKNVWETMIIDSTYLQQRFGARRNEDMRLAQEEDIDEV